ncbi:MAG: putative metal-dependent phosphoesterase TrpH, partial [Candidatus Paceibacteria bacterium]
MKRLILLASCLGLYALGVASMSSSGEKQWYKGNTHTHTLWSDGNAAPERVVAFYTEHDYDFLVLSDHNILSQGERWFPVKEGRLTEEKLAGLIETFGAEQVVVRDEPQREMRLQTLQELRGRFEKP